MHRSKQITALASVLLLHVAAGSPAPAQESMFELLVGNWYDKSTQTNVEISKFGSVSSNFSKGLVGRVKESTKGNSNFGFFAEDRECYYRVTWLGDGSRSNWKLVFDEPKGYCPPGGDYEIAADPEDLLKKKKQQADQLEAAQKKADEAAQATAEAVRNAEAQAKAAAEEKARADKRRADAEAKRAKGPSELKNADIVYFEKPSDDGVVSTALSSNNVVFSTRAGENGGVSDTITCTPDVDITALQKLANILIDAGVGIRNISPSVYGSKFINRMTIESYSVPAAVPPLSKYQIENLSSCSQKRNYITIENKCSTPVKVYVRYNRATDGKWSTIYGGVLSPYSKRSLKDDSGYYLTTDSVIHYFYGWRTRDDGATGQFMGQGENSFPIGSGQIKSFIKSNSAIDQLTCDE
ncbi:hypothetical protein ACLBXO_05280 [Methylobacterium sp. C33D]